MLAFSMPISRFRMILFQREGTTVSKIYQWYIIDCVSAMFRIKAAVRELTTVLRKFCTKLRKKGLIYFLSHFSCFIKRLILQSRGGSVPCIFFNLDAMYSCLHFRFRQINTSVSTVLCSQQWQRLVEDCFQKVFSVLPKHIVTV